MKSKPWTPEEMLRLDAEYPHIKTATLAMRMGRTEKQLYQKAKQMGVKKSAAYLASPDACRLRQGGEVGKATRFQKDQPAWNKGTSYQAGGRCRETQFKKGHLGGRAIQIVKPIGFERISKDGYLERKVNNDMPLQKRWRAVHRIVWEEANGPIPANHAICFKPGMFTNKREEITIDRLELVHRKDLMRRNSIYNYPKPIQDVIKLRGAVARQINKRAKEAA